MICCNECPFNPTTGTAPQRCSEVICRGSSELCDTAGCQRNFPTRCFRDYYVVDRLFQADPLAVSLADASFRSACRRRDRPLLLALFYAGGDDLRRRFWRLLRREFSESIRLLNPLFVAVGLAPVADCTRLVGKSEEYYRAVMINPYIGGRFEGARNSILKREGDYGLL